VINQRTEINKFSLKRVMHLVKIEAKGYIWGLIGITLFGAIITIGIILFWMVFMPSMTTGSTSSFFETSGINYSLLIFFVIITMNVPMIVCMNSFPRPKIGSDILAKNDNYLLLPASSLEKYLSKLFGIFVIGGLLFSVGAIISLLIYNVNSDITGFYTYFLAYKTMIITAYSYFSILFLWCIYNYNLSNSDIGKIKKTITWIILLIPLFAILAILDEPFFPTLPKESLEFISESGFFSTESPSVFSFVISVCSKRNVFAILRSIFVMGSPIFLIIGYNMWKNIEGTSGRHD